MWTRVEDASKIARGIRAATLTESRRCAQSASSASFTNRPSTSTNAKKLKLSVDRGIASELVNEHNLLYDTLN